MEQRLSDLSNYRTKLFSGIFAGFLEYTVDSPVLQGPLVINNIKRESDTAFHALSRTAFEMVKHRNVPDQRIACPDNVDKFPYRDSMGENKR
jgi:hypothetical protein